MKRTLFLAFFVLSRTDLVQGQQVADMQARVRSAMATSLEQQRASVKRQVETAREAPASFFTVPWRTTEPLSIPRDSDIDQAAAFFDCDPLPESELEPLIRSAAAREKLKPALLRAIIRKESAGRTCATSAKGAQGLMQLMPATQADLGVTDASDPQQNIDAGARFLRTLIDRYAGNLSLALSAYNAGPARVDRDGTVPEIAETKDYVAEILRWTESDPEEVADKKAP